ncbi:MAG: RNA polymerase ECF-type sigma factor, partial [uncultured Rubrobacteraceae bacterium]
DGRKAGRRGPHAGGVPQGVALGGRVPPRARERSHLGALDRPQPRHRPAPVD